ncbi:DUF4238 domain-containing protein [Paracoccus sp. 08]|uniref:DUF4238 domain-containing protein n=1 Tax=Paracoccus sp. 08 TaxID=2606624 RepID=UPI0020961721|nr:DUF4238 domain-containing protein [Paracoccus sp. 08]MCO6361896.1 DUF4238 domain-containing protein [Paracoccus sp. 08]
MAKSRRSTRHHYIPKTVQRAFVIEGEKDRIWYSERCSRTGLFMAPEIRNIDSTFQEKNLYTVNYDSTPSDVIERAFYGPLDNHLGLIIPQIISALDDGALPVFSDESERSMRLVVVEMMKRTPNAFEGLELDSVVQRVLNEPPAQDFPEDVLQAFRRDLENPAYIEKFKREVFARGRIRPLKNVNKTLEEFSVRWGICKGKHSFVLSSRYCYMIGNGGPSGLANENVELWMPISPKYCMVLVRDAFGRVPKLCEVDSAMVRKFNLHSLRNSHAIASHSQKLIESIIGKSAVIR